MSFSAFANHVRNPAHPYRRRVSALRSGVQLYRPIGFEAGLRPARGRRSPRRPHERLLAGRMNVMSETCRLDYGDLSPEARMSLEATATALGARLTHDLYQDDPVTYNRTRDLLFLAHLLRTAADPSFR